MPVEKYYSRHEIGDPSSGISGMHCKFIVGELENVKPMKLEHMRKN